MNFDYKKYSLENLENWLHDAMSSGEATPQEIYDVIVGVVKENYYHHKHHASQAYELMEKLNSNNPFKSFVPKSNEVNIDNIIYSEGYDWTPLPPKDKVVKWQLPVEVDGLTGECYVNFPDDLLKAANLKEGDTVQWIDNGDGTYTLKKV